MESFKNTIIILLLVFGLLTPVVQAKSPSLLLQEGLYAEETEGNLEKAIGLYEQVLEQYKEVKRLAARATYQLGMCHLKKGENEKAAEYFQQVVSKYPIQKMLAKKADEQLKKVKPETKKSVFERIDGQVIRFISETYGQTAGEAGQKNLYANSHIYYVAPDFVLYNGGMGFYYNWTGRTITQKVRLSGTSYPNQTHYGVDGQKLNTKVVPDKARPNHWQIYWIPEEPLAPEEYLYYGWSINNKRKLPKMPSGAYSLVMQNKYGSPVIETFFLVLPKELKISQSNSPTGSKELLNFDVYWWTKQVQQGENHLERVRLEKNSSAQYAARLKNKVTVSIAKNPNGDRLTVQYAAIEICKTADVPYQWDKSQKLAGEKAKQYIEPINFENTVANEALNSILEPLELKYVIDTGGVYLTDTKEWAQGLVEDFFKHNYRDITSRKTIEWGNPVTDTNGNVSINYKCEMIIWDKDKFLANQIFTFDKNGKYLNVQKVEGFPKPLGKVDVLPEDVSTNLEKGKDENGSFYTPADTIKSFVKAVYDGNLEAAMACVSKDGHDYDEFKEMLATESNHPFQAMIKAMDVSVPVEITSKSIKDGKCKISWYLTLGRVYYIGDTKMKKGTHQKFGSHLELVGDKWLIRDI